MTPTPEEAELTTAYRQEAEHYRRALARALPLADLLARGQAADASLRGMTEALDAVALIEQHIGPAKARFHTRGQPAGPELQAALDEVAGLIQQLLGHGAEAEAQARARRDQLLPQITATARRRQMLDAYGSPATAP